ncbi:MAG: HIT family protein [Anaerolineales bacterium]
MVGKMTDCIFCKILAGELPASFVYRDETCAAFMDIQPINPGHVLVIPHRHAANLAELDPAIGGQLFQIGQQIAAALYASGIPCEGVNYFLADGEAAGQEVFHVHLHVFPRFEGDGFGLKLSPKYFQLPEREELDRVAQRIRNIQYPISNYQLPNCKIT